ncbi:MAG: hypothetical protein WC829_01080 [Hyphomicrobium sp.]|jgi:hypothetical protein
MKRLIPVFLLALALAGCANLPNPFASFSNPLTTPTLAAVESTYGAALSVAVGYRDACAARTIPVSCRTVVPIVQAYGKRAQGAIVAARGFVKNNPKLDATSLLIAAQTAVTDFKDVQNKLGVK